MLLSHTIITYTIILPSPEATPLQYFWSSSLKYFNANKKKTKNQKIFLICSNVFTIKTIILICIDQEKVYIDITLGF